jgi:hypothetical protein
MAGKHTALRHAAQTLKSCLAFVHLCYGSIRKNITHRHAGFFAAGAF